MNLGLVIQPLIFQSLLFNKSWVSPSGSKVTQDGGGVLVELGLLTPGIGHSLASIDRA